MGLLRPATPLSVIFFIAFVLLLLSTLSTPVIEGIPLGSFQGYNFGVLGYCKGKKCVGPRIGYSTDGLFSGPDTDADFTLPSSARHSLSSILIVHPIAALLTLVCFGLAVAAHFHGPSHSPRYLLALLILTFPTLLITLLAFLVDILLFVPHMQWGGWIVLGATILIIGSSIVTCAMRRTLVSRKARKKRIAENPDMNGTNYYENLNQQRMMADNALPRAESPPPMSGSTAVDQSAGFAAFEMKRQDTHESNGATTNGFSGDDRTPLNPARDPSVRSSSTNGRRPYGDENVLPMPQRGNGMGRRPSRDQYGNPIPSSAEFGMAPGGLRSQNSQGSLGSGRPNGPPRGRGGYGPGPRGYGPPRGGFGPPRGAYGPRGGRGGYGPPPPGFNGRGRGYGPPPPGMFMGRGGRNAPPPGYAQDPRYGSRGPSPQYEQPPPPSVDAQFVAGPAVPIGQAIEMDERNGYPPQPREPQQYGENTYGLRDSDGDVAGMVNLMQGRGDQPISPLRNSNGIQGDGQPLVSPTSLYSDRPYVPPRQEWNGVQSPLGMPDVRDSDPISDPHSSTAAPSSGALPPSPHAISPSAASHNGSGPHSPRHQRTGSEPYYEDVDPRFAEDPTPFHQQRGPRESGIPNALTPGPGQAYSHNNNNDPYRMQSPPIHLPATDEERISSSLPAVTALGVDGRPRTDNSASDSSIEPHQSASSDNLRRIGPPTPTSGSDVAAARHQAYPGDYLDPIPDGTRSPGEASESSHFTSVSQRGVNPNWLPQQGGGPGGGMHYGPAPPFAPANYSGVSSASATQRRKEDVILSANPDFSLPGVPVGGRGAARGPSRLGRAGSTGGSGGLTPAGRYPTGLADGI